MARGFGLEDLPDLFTNPTNVSKIQVAIGLTGCTDANEGELRIINRVDRIDGSAKPACFDGVGNDFPNFCFDNGRLSTVDQVNFGRKRVNTNDFMSVVGETPRGNRTHVTEAKDAQV